MAEVLSIWTGIPVYKLTEEETKKLLNMEEELHKRVIGQEQAIKAVSQAIRRTRAGLKDPKRPSGSFIFLGPSGVGKTELAKTLSEFLFGDEQSLISLDMSEYMEKHTVSRLVGSPPGYVGYEEGGQLTEAVRRKPFSVVLFDEIEKAHPDVFNTLLQILEEGRLTDSQGRSVDFRNTVLIMTSNLGTRDLRKANVGFGKSDEAVTYEKMKEKVNDALKEHFRPEFLNRIDETVVFHELSKDEVTTIVDLMIKRTRVQLEGLGHRARAHRRLQAAAGRAGLRPHPRRPPAAPGHPALRRGPAVGEAPLQGVPRRRDHHRRRRARPGQRRQARHRLPGRRGLRAPAGRDGRGRPRRLTSPPITARSPGPRPGLRRVRARGARRRPVGARRSVAIPGATGPAAVRDGARVVPARRSAVDLAALVLQVGPDEPVVELEVVGLADEQVLRHRVDVAAELDGLAVVLDDADVDVVEGLQVVVGDGAVEAVVVPRPALDDGPGVPRGWPPRVAMRSATVSTISETPAYCGSSISWTPMKLGPTTFQWMCLRVRVRSIRASRRSCRASRTLAASASSRPGAV